MKTNRFSVVFSAVALAGLLSINSMIVPEIVEAAPATQRVVESIPARMSQERILDEQAFAARTLEVAGTTFESTSDVLREQRLGSPQVTDFTSTSDVLRDLEIGTGPTAAESGIAPLYDVGEYDARTSTGLVRPSGVPETALSANGNAHAPVLLHEERPAATGGMSGR